MLHSTLQSETSSSAPPCSLQQQQQQQLHYHGDLIDDSLTDIRWLGSMDGRMNFPSMEQSNYRQRHSNHLKPNGKRICKKLNYTKKDSKTDAHKIRPPFSYAALIALAINSDPQRMLTLNSIYQWIENNFPFFRLPEARAWKNSIRHNLSIKKNLFQKVYIDPPRRSNGAYWTLLNEGIDEVERCMKLFTTLRPPVIDKSSMYYTDNNPTHLVVRSRGQFIPAMDADEEDNLLCDCPFKVKDEVIEEELVNEEIDEHMFQSKTLNSELPILPAVHSNNTSSTMTMSTKLRHPLEYSQDYYTKAYPPSIQPFNGPVRTTLGVSATSGLHSNDHSNSSFPDLSFLTPMKTDLLNSENGLLAAISPAAMTSSQTNKRSFYHVPSGTGAAPSANQSYSPLCTPLKPLLTEAGGGGDSGVFSPSNFQFCTPIKDIGELLQITTSHEADLYPNQFESTPPGQCHKSSLLCGLNSGSQF